MLLTSGTKLGQYDIIAPLGAGGMGEVYRARDTVLGREVAIKVLPALLSQDPDRLRRFEQEARAAAALNHPNILAVFQMGTYEGAPYLVSELLEGSTLRELLVRRPLPLRKALDSAVQIARGLAAAHEKGIVHRDLKPENLFVSKDGRVKILDFGLAKLTRPHLISTQSAPTASQGTEPGVVMGTVGYMSPEQVRGQTADHRADIFALGAILYEMLTGRRAFCNTTSAETMAAILNEDPPGMSQIAPTIPPALQRVVHRCLDKNPEQRFQSASDLAFAMEALSDSGTSFGSAALHLSPSRTFVWTLSALVLLVLAIGLAWWFMRAPITASAPTLTLTRLTSDFGLTTDPVLSPDGKLLAYASDRSGEGHLDIYVKQVGGGEPLRLTQGPGDKHQPSFSPEGTTIAFRSEQEGGGIYVVPALGGPARRIVSGGSQPQFSPDGNWIAYSLQLGACFGTRDLCRIYVVPSGGGEPRQLRPDFAAAFYAVWSPDGKHLLFLGNPDEKLPREEGFDWYVTPRDSGPPIKTGALEATRDADLSGPVQVYRWMLDAPAWQAPGDALIFSARSGDSTNLWRIGISPKTWKVTGPPQRLTSGATLEEAPSVASGPAGKVRLTFASVSENPSIWSLPIDANQGKITGQPKRLTQDAAADFHPALSPEGNKMAWVSARSGSQEIWIRDLRTGEDSALTASRTDKYEPHFSPDGSRVSFSSYENKKWNIYIMPVSGGTPEMVCEDCGEANSWSPDGKWILGNRLEGQTWALDVASRRKSDLLSTRQWAEPGGFSPDNRWLAFDASDRAYIAPFQGESAIPESSWIRIMDAAAGMQWSPDGKLIYAKSWRDGFTCIWAQRIDAVTRRPVGTPFAVFHSHSARLSLANQPSDFEVAVGRNKMLFNMGERTGNIWMAEWKEQ